jgi:hypothetical protein
LGDDGFEQWAFAHRLKNGLDDGLLVFWVGDVDTLRARFFGAGFFGAGFGFDAGFFGFAAGFFGFGAGFFGLGAGFGFGAAFFGAGRPRRARIFAMSSVLFIERNAFSGMRVFPGR